MATNNNASDNAGKPFTMALPLATVLDRFPDFKLGWTENVSGGHFLSMTNPKIGSINHMVICLVQEKPNSLRIVDGQKIVEYDILKPMYDQPVIGDGAINPETGLSKTNAVLGVVAEAYDGYHLLVMEEERSIIREPDPAEFPVSKGRWGNFGNPVVETCTIPGGYSDPKDAKAVETALREFLEEVGDFSFEGLEIRLLNVGSANRATTETCSATYMCVLPGRNHNIQQINAGILQRSPEKLAKNKNRRFVRVDKIDPLESRDYLNSGFLLNIFSALGCIKNR